MRLPTQKTFLLVGILIPLILSAATFFITTNKSHPDRFSIIDYSALLTFTFTLVLMGSFILLYLNRGGTTSSERHKGSEYQIMKLLTAINDKLDLHPTVNTNELLELRQYVRQLSMQEERDREWEEFDPKDERIPYFVDDYYSTLVRRLHSEIKSLIYRSNLNLTIGIILTIGGLFLLGYFVVSTSPHSLNQINYTEEAIHYISRLTLIVFIELFAYFFLRLYKAMLEDIKYYQNEITNVQSKKIALITSLLCDDNTLIKEIVQQVVSTERNFILNKNETTTELEKLRIEKQSTDNIGQVAKAIIENLRSSKKE